MRVLITGGCGKCGTALTGLTCDKRFVDTRERVELLRGEDFVRGDASNAELLSSTMRGCDAVIHLAYQPPTGSCSEEDSILENVGMMMTILKTASQRGVGRVIYASSNHVVGMYEKDNVPGIYRLGHTIRVDKHSPIRPDSMYAVNKACCEHLGRFHGENGGPRFYALRIGGLLDADHDHPYAYAEQGVSDGQWLSNSDQYDFYANRLKCVWQSRRDFLQMVALCLVYDGPEFDIFYGVSHNTRRWLDIDDARIRLGYVARDNAEAFTAPPESAIHQILV